MAAALASVFHRGARPLKYVMPQPRPSLGDRHNFGRSVTRHGERVHKPRALLWEWLLLHPKSPLRIALARAASEDELAEGAFDFLPSLRFFQRTPLGGHVEALELLPLRTRSAETRRKLAEITGRAVALFTWLGLSDLHWENLVLGVDARGRIVFGPLDVEMILADLSSPTETKLLPDADPEYAAVCQHAAGVRRVLPYLGKPVQPADLLAMLGGYRETLGCLTRHARELGRVFADLAELRQTPIRVCLRGTEEYVRAEPAALWPPLLPEELLQLERGDVPYFFRLYGERGIHYFASADLKRTQRLPLRGDVPQLEPLLRVERGLGSAQRKRLSVEGLFTLLAAFDHADFSGRHRGAGLEVGFSARSLSLVLPDGEELRTSRDLSAFVSSVYMPCRCGEVRSVFVPKVTRCSLAGRGV